MKINDNISFENSLAELESSVLRLEGGSLTLDESLEEFERAVSLLKICGARLEEAKQKVRILTEGADGTVTDAPFSVDEDEN